MHDEERPKHDVPLRWAVVVLVAIIGLACVPVWVVKYPPMVDYPMHVARAFLLSLPQDGQGITEFFQAQVRAVPNLGMDLLVSAMARVMPPLLAGKVFLCLILFGLVTGGFAFSVALHKRITVAAFLPALALYDLWFFMGFANYLFGVGLAFWGVAVFLWSEKWPTGKRWTVLALFFVVLLVCHLMALAVAVASCIALSVKDGPKTKAAMKVFVVSLALCVVAYVGLTLTGRTAIRWDGRMDTLRNTFGFTPFGIVGFVAIVGFGGSLRGAKRWAPLVVGLLTFLAVGPSFLIGTAFASDRLSLPLLIVLLGSATFGDLRGKWNVVVLVACAYAAVSFVRIQEWLSLAKIVESRVALLAAVPDRATLATFDIGDSAQPTWKYQRHVADWVLLDRPVFVAQNFAKRNQQPMVFRPEFEEWHAFQENNPIELKDWEALEPQLSAAKKIQARLNANYASQGRPLAGFYVLVLHTADRQPPADGVPGTTVVTSDSLSTLLKVE